jgi:hypothetical protein
MTGNIEHLRTYPNPNPTTVSRPSSIFSTRPSKRFQRQLLQVRSSLSSTYCFSKAVIPSVRAALTENPVSTRLSQRPKSFHLQRSHLLNNRPHSIHVNSNIESIPSSIIIASARNIQLVSTTHSQTHKPKDYPEHRTSQTKLKTKTKSTRLPCLASPPRLSDNIISVFFTPQAHQILVPSEQNGIEQYQSTQAKKSSKNPQKHTTAVIPR